MLKRRILSLMFSERASGWQEAAAGTLLGGIPVGAQVERLTSRTPSEGGCVDPDPVARPRAEASVKTKGPQVVGGKPSGGT